MILPQPERVKRTATQAGASDENMLPVIQKQKVNDIIRCKKCDVFQKLVVFFVLAYITIMLYVGGMLMMVLLCLLLSG